MSLLRPVATGPITQPFDGTFGWEPQGWLQRGTTPRGKRVKFLTAKYYPHLHLAIDYLVPTGTPVVAVKSGTIVAQGTETTFGEVFVLLRVRQGTDYQVLAFYTHLKAGSFRYEVGDSVTKGATLALSNASGRVTGPHLHFELRRGKRGARPLTSWGTDWVLYDPQPFIDGTASLKEIAP